MQSINELFLFLKENAHRNLHIIFKSKLTQNGSARRYQNFQVKSDDDAIYIGDSDDFTKRPYRIDKHYIKDINVEVLCDLTLVTITYENNERYEIFTQDNFVFNT